MKQKEENKRAEINEMETRKTENKTMKLKSISS